MSRTRPPYPEEYRQQILALIRAGRAVEELEKEFEPSAQTIRNWIVQDQLDRGEREDGVTIDELMEVMARRIEFYNGERYHSSLGKRAPQVFIRQEHPEHAQLHINEVKLVQLSGRSSRRSGEIHVGGG